MNISVAEEIRDIMNLRDAYLEKISYVQRAQSICVKIDDSTSTTFERGYPNGDEMFRLLEDGYAKIVKGMEDQIHGMFATASLISE